MTAVAFATNCGNLHNKIYNILLPNISLKKFLILLNFLIKKHKKSTPITACFDLLRS